MTIVVGILCNEGVVIAADGMASQNISGNHFVGKDNQKLTVIRKNECILGVSGQDTLNNLLISYLTNNYDNIINENIQDENEFVYTIQRGFYEYYEKLHILPLLNSTISRESVQYGKNMITKQQMLNEFFNQQASSIIGFKFKDKHYIANISGITNCPHILREHGIFYTMIGEGLLIADPSMHLIKNILNINSSPNIYEAELLAYWAISHAIKVSCGGIGGNISITKLKLDEKKQYKSEFSTDNSNLKTVVDDIYKVYANSQSNIISSIKADTCL
jgi:hypothetical protein